MIFRVLCLFCAYRMEAGRFKVMIGIIQQYITLRILTSPYVFSLHNDDYIPAATRTLGLFCK